ncbi:MAG: hypothetical protein KF800_13455 [Lysobacter sp.]|nr:hypothetical protein [Lysobacter sp.]
MKALPSRFFAYALFLLLVNAWCCASVFASASVEEQPLSIKKNYVNGNSIELVCEKVGSECSVSTNIHKKSREFSVKFVDYDVRPDMQGVSLYIQSEDGSEYSISVSVVCEDEDMALVPPDIGIAECLAFFRVADGKIEGRPRVQISPITTQMLYRHHDTEDRDTHK